MKKLTKEEAYRHGKEAREKGLPSAPLFNKAFWELNNRNQQLIWKENIDAYIAGWHNKKEPNHGN